MGFRRFWGLYTLVLLSVIISVSGTSFADQVTQVSIDPSKVVGTIKPQALVGLNVNTAMMVINVKKMLDPLKVSAITYPAGNVGDEADKNVYGDAPLTMFKQQQKQLGMPFTFFQVRLFNSTPEFAADTVRRVLAMGIRVDVWTIGNEADLYGSARGDKSWNPEKYSKVFREYATAMRAVKPDLKLAGPGCSQPKDGWIEPFVAECGDIVDVLMWHWYPVSPGVDAEAALDTASNAVDDIQRYRDLLTDPQTNPKGYKRDIKLAINEYAIHWNSNIFTFLTDMVGAMWTAEVLGYYGQTGLDYSCYFCLGAYGGHALFENPPSYMERPVYYSLLFYRNHFGTSMVSATSSDPLVKTFASIDGKGKHYIMLINKDPDNVKTTLINWPNGKPTPKTLQGFVLTEERSGEKMREDELKPVDDKISVTLPPYSVVAVEF